MFVPANHRITMANFAIAPCTLDIPVGPGGLALLGQERRRSPKLKQWRESPAPWDGLGTAMSTLNESYGGAGLIWLA